jgi:hypothetical protein
MCEASLGKPYCAKAQKFLSEKAIEHTQCEECWYIRYIGCPGFSQKGTAVNEKVREYINYFHLQRKEPAPQIVVDEQQKEKEA